MTPGDVSATICRPGGYTASVRPPESTTEPAKRVSALAYGITAAPDGYEYDHLIPLGLGGASDIRNLWPEPDLGGSGSYIANAKDQVEDDLHAAVCEGTAGLIAAQDAMATNWTTAEAVLDVPFGSGQ